MRRALLLAALLAGALTGCGGDDAADPAAPPRPTAAAFPSAAGKTLQTLRAGLPKGPQLAPTTAAALQVGDNRLAFALFDDERRQVRDADVAVYTTDARGRDVRGPYRAREESLAVAPQFESRTTSVDPDAAKVLYVADVPVPAAGRRVFTGVARLDGRTFATSGFEVRVPRVDARGGPPEVGDPAPRTHTRTLGDVAGDATRLTTRQPPAEALLRDDFADVVGRRPAVITFATPLLCQTRVCGPVVDVVEQVRSRTGGDVAFIQQEIYRDNDVGAGFVPQVRSWRLPTEPWTFVVDRRGRVAERFEGAVSVGELERAVARVL